MVPRPRESRRPRILLDVVVGLFVAGLVIGVKSTWMPADSSPSCRAGGSSSSAAGTADAGSGRGRLALQQPGGQQQQQQQQGLGAAAAGSSSNEVSGTLAAQCPAKWQQLYFVHLPKTAGTFVKNIIKAGLSGLGTGSGAPGAWCRVDRIPEVYNGCTPPKPPGAPDVPGPPPYNQAGMFPRVLASLFPGFCNGLAAHADFGIAGAVLPPESWATTLLVTVLREPVARTISSFYFRQKFCRHALAQPDCDYDFSGNETQIYAELFKHATRNANRMTQQLGGWTRCAWRSAAGEFSPTLGCMQAGGSSGSSLGSSQSGDSRGAGGGVTGEAACRGFAGVNSLEGGDGSWEPTPEQQLAAAKANLARFCWVGLQERMGESLEVLRRVAGWGGLNITGWAPVNEHSHVQPPQWVQDRVAEINSLDMQLYEYATQLFEVRLRELGMAGGVDADGGQQAQQEQQLGAGGAGGWDEEA